MTNHKVLAVGAHFDDVELGCAGSLARHKTKGDDVHVFVASKSGFRDPNGNSVRDSETARSEGMAAASIIGIDALHEGGFETNNIPLDDRLTAKIRGIIDKYKIDWVYTHWCDDAHIDHQNVARATLSAARHIPRVLFYRSNHFMGANQPNYNFFVDVSGHMDTKISALKAFESEYARAGKMWHDTVITEATYWGKRMGTKYAEGFVASRFFLAP